MIREVSKFNFGGPVVNDDRPLRLRLQPEVAALARRQPQEIAADELGAALTALHGETVKLLDMLQRDGRLWLHAADHLPLIAARAYAAIQAQGTPL